MKEKVLETNQALLDDEKTFNRNKWLFCTSGIGRDALYTLVSTYFLTYVQFGLTLTLAQYSVLTLMIGVLGRIWDGINDPMMGAIIEGTHLKWGKFKPWIFIGAVLDSLLTLVLFNLGRDWNGWLYVVIICLVYLLFEAAFTMNDIGYWSMIPSLSRTKERRDKISTLTVFFAGIGAILMTGLYTLFAQGQLLTAFTIFSIIACVLVIGGQTYTAFGVKEGPREDMDKISEEEKKKSDVSLKKMVKTIVQNKQLLWISIAHLCNSTVTGILLGLIYNFYYLEKGYDGDTFYFVVVYALANTVLQLLYPKLAQKFSRKKIQLVSYIVTAVGFVGMMLIGWGEEGSFYNTILPFNIVTLCIFGLLIFAGNTLFYTANIINFNNCVEYNEYITGERSEAVVTTMRPLIVKFADAIKYLTITVVLAITGLYGLSKNISTMETQVNYFNNLSYIATDEEKSNKSFKTDAYTYIAEYHLFQIEYALMNDEQKADAEYLESVISENYEALNACQFDASYMDVVGQLLVVETKEDGTKVTLGDLDHTIALTLNPNSKYSLSLNDGVTNVANTNFKDKANIGTRIGVRIAFCIIPLVLQTLSIVIQRKKFIIDEEYFDKITKEIEERKQA